MNSVAMVSLYPSITHITHGTDLTIESVLADIPSGQWRAEVEAVIIGIEGNCVLNLILL